MEIKRTVQRIHQIEVDYSKDKHDRQTLTKLTKTRGGSLSILKQGQTAEAMTATLLSLSFILSVLL